MPRTGEFVYDPTRADFQANAHAIYRTLRDGASRLRESGNGHLGALALQRRPRRRHRHRRVLLENTDITVGLLPQIQSMDPPRHDALRTWYRARSPAGAPTRWSRASARSRGA
jgi:hypothetical protein